MKTNHASRHIVRIRRVLSLFTFVLLVGFAAAFGGTMAGRLAPASTTTDAGQPPSGSWNITVSVPDLSMLTR